MDKPEGATAKEAGLASDTGNEFVQQKEMQF
jgi:hypothetical protein